MGLTQLGSSPGSFTWLDQIQFQSLPHIRLDQSSSTAGSDPGWRTLPQVRSHPGSATQEDRGTAGDTTHPKDSQGTSPQNPHSQKKEKPEKWRQAGVSNPKVLVFIQTRAQHCSVPNAPKPFYFILPEGSRGGQLGASAPHPPLHGRSSCPGPAPTPRTNSKIHSAGFCQLPEFRNPPPQRCRGGGREGGAAALPPPPTALTETLF